MNDSAVTDLRACPHCRSGNRWEATHCWMCLQPFATREVVEAELVDPARETKPLSEMFFSLLLLGILIFLVLVAIGISLDDPGMLVPFAIAVVPALIAAGSRYFSSRGARDRNPAVKSFLAFIMTLAITIGVIVLLLAAAIVAFFVYCLFAIQQMR